MTLLLSTSAGADTQAALLVVFILVVIAAANLSAGAVGRTWGFLGRSLNTSGQAPVRLTVLLVFGLVVIASELGLDLIPGAFAAGMIVRLVLHGRQAHRFESKIEAIGFGFLIPFFFIKSGMDLDLAALAGGVGAVLKIPLFMFAFSSPAAYPPWSFTAASSDLPTG